MIIRDVMPAFELYQPTQLRDAFALLDRFGKDAWKMAGGYDSLSWFKERIKRPKAVIDLSGIAEMKGIRETPDGIEIGALTTLTEIERHPAIKAKYRVLADAAAKVASPQIRNHGTLGGNASQDARCTYYRYGLPCYRAGGNACYADTPEGVNCVPRRLTAVEQIVKGKPMGADIAKLAGASATRGAKPLNYNQFKIPLMANLVTRAIRDARA